VFFFFFSQYQVQPVDVEVQPGDEEKIHPVHDKVPPDYDERQTLDNGPQVVHDAIPADDEIAPIDDGIWYPKTELGKGGQG